MIVLADSDMLVGRDYLDRVVAALERPGVGAVTCLYRGIAVPGIWSRLATQWIDFHFLPSVVVGMALGLAKPCFGSTIALRRDTLERIGGFMAFKDRLADDYAIGEAVRGLGLSVAVPRDLVLGHTCTAASFGALLRQELRWSRTIRSLDPAGFVGSAVTHPIAWATLAPSGPASALPPWACWAPLLHRGYCCSFSWPALSARVRMALFSARSATTRLSWSFFSASGPVRSTGAAIVSRSNPMGPSRRPTSQDHDAHAFSSGSFLRRLRRRRRRPLSDEA